MDTGTLLMGPDCRDSFERKTEVPIWIVTHFDGVSGVISPNAVYAVDREGGIIAKDR